MNKQVSKESPSINAENVAGLPRRLLAYVLDCVILFLALLLLHAIMYFLGLNPVVSGRLSAVGFQFYMWVFISATLPAVGYFYYFFKKEQTPAMRLTRLRVKSIVAPGISGKSAFLRSIVLLLPFELNHAIWFLLFPGMHHQSVVFWLIIAAFYIIIFLYLLLPLLSPKGQSVHDYAAETMVVRIKAG
ncbi:MAG: RDD family protein [Balneolales bacterium]|nr:RDD family protein [Balneolales bacterium]